MGAPSRMASCLAAVLLAALVCACSSLPPVPGSERNYAGRFSLAVTRSGAGLQEQRNAWSGRFSLAVGARSMTLDLVSPLGATIARFETDRNEARLLVPSNGGLRVERGADAQSLAERVLGWSLPIAGMPDWVEGRPARDRPYRALSADGASERFEQDGWAVTIEPARSGGPGRRVQMDRAETDDAPAVALRVVLDTPPS